MTLNRRTFLAAAAAVPSTLNALTGDSGPIKLSVATYSLRSFKRPEAIKMIQQLNIKYADVKDVHLAIKDGTPGNLERRRQGVPRRRHQARRLRQRLHAEARRSAAGIRICQSGRLPHHRLRADS